MNLFCADASCGDFFPHLSVSRNGRWKSVALSLSASSLIAASSRRAVLTSASASSSNSSASGQISGLLERFPLKAAATAGCLALTGDTIAQVRERSRKAKAEERGAGEESSTDSLGDKIQRFITGHDYVRALRMASYGFLLYGPGSQLWYQFLERKLPGTGLNNFAMKVLANQVCLGPCVLLVVFSWNFAWMGKLQQVPDKLRRDFVPSLVDGWKFWIPASAVNFALIPLSFRVAYMSTCAIFWNFYLSTSVGKDIKQSTALVK